jgi:signal transduction histidine kinase
MNFEWSVVEIVAILVENGVFIFFLNSRYISKNQIFYPQIISWLVLVSWGLAATFLGWPAYDLISHIIMLMYLLLTKHGTFSEKVIGVMMVWGIMIATSMAGAGLASLLTDTSIKHTLLYQDTARLLAIILIKMIQVVVFYVLSMKHQSIRNVQKSPVIVLTLAAIVDFTFIIVIRAYIEHLELNPVVRYLLVWIAIGLLLVMISIFLMYELFVREEIKNVNLAIKLQRLELETQFFNEIDVMYQDLRTWRHEYKNNLTALRALVEHQENEKALHYFDKLATDSSNNSVTLQTGNYVLDAVVSSKLWLAKSQHIDVSIQAVYPENNHIDDHDLCAIIGNLLDNAIDACGRMKEKNDKKYINFSILLQGKNLVISIANSYNNELRRKGEQYLTLKKEAFHGLGIAYVDSIVGKYGGHVLRSDKNGIFETHVMLPLLQFDRESKK